MNDAKRMVVLTGGGDAPGLNAVLYALVTTAEAHGVTCLASEDGFEGLIQGKLSPLDSKRVQGIASLGGSVIGCSNRANPFAYPHRRSDGSLGTEDVSARVLDTLSREKIDVLVALGGDGTMAMMSRFGPMGVKTLGVPKTIDNDLAATDVTFGFQSAVDFATLAIDRIHTTAAAHDRVMIVEVMGRYAGWIALESGLAGGAHAIVLPEFAYEPEMIAAKIQERAAMGEHYSIVVISEGARPVGGDHAILKLMPEGHLPRLGGAGERLARALEVLVPDHEVRVTVLGHLLRGGSPCASDRVLALRFGVEAAHAVLRDERDVMVSLRNGVVCTVPLAEAVGRNRFVQRDTDTLTAARALGISFGVDWESPKQS
ncbi:MAG: ATP-dependent 6-phosphofructokinase [Deltaproteobacteria bacterium]|nr:ATP-dependent 6-phosphofructokinase [Deltaproteobacteria bacterium]